MIKHVKKLIKKAANAKDENMALVYARAASECASAVSIIKIIKEKK